MFHTYFIGSAEGLLFDVPRRRLRHEPVGAAAAATSHASASRCATSETVEHLAGAGDGVEVTLGSGEQRRAERRGGPPTRGRRAARSSTPVPASRRLRASGWAAGRNAPPFAVWRLWLDRRADRRARRRSSAPAASGRWTTSRCWSASRTAPGAGRRSAAAPWSSCTPTPCPTGSTRPRSGPSSGTSWTGLPRAVGRRRPRRGVAGGADCPLAGTAPWQLRPEVATPDPASCWPATASAATTRWP